MAFAATSNSVPAWAQDRPAAAFPRAAATPASANGEQSDILVKGQRPGSTCNGKASAQPIDLACLNGQLKAAATSAQPAPSAADQTTAQATTPSKVGTFSFSATSQRMGKNFGHSAEPYRPPAPIISNAITGGRSPK